MFYDLEYAGIQHSVMGMLMIECARFLRIPVADARRELAWQQHATPFDLAVLVAEVSINSAVAVLPINCPTTPQALNIFPQITCAVHASLRDLSVACVSIVDVETALPTRAIALHRRVNFCSCRCCDLRLAEYSDTVTHAREHAAQ